MEVPTLKKRPRRFCEHCNTELCHTQYFDHRKRYFKNGVWEKKSQSQSQALAFNSSSTTLHGRDQHLSADPQTGKNKLLDAASGLSRQITQFAADVKEQFTAVNSRMLSIEDRLSALESKNCVEETNSKKRRRVHNPKTAEAVRRLHISETNCRRYEPEQGPRLKTSPCLL